MSDIKPRKMFVNVTVSSGDATTATWNEADQVLVLAVERDGKIVSAEAVESTIYYERPKKPKVLSKVHARRSGDFSLEQSEIVRRYAQCWAIDTSSEEAFEGRFNVAALCAVNPAGTGEVDRVGGLLFGKTSGNPERFGWRRWIEFLLQSTDAEQRYAIIVDSELREISSMNDRRKPIHGDFFLPENFDMIYATADAAADQVFNKAIKAADRLSQEMRRSLQSEKNQRYFLDLIDEETHRPMVLFCSETAR